MNCISTWIHIDSKEDATYFPQVGVLSSDKKAQEKYWRCVYTFYKFSTHYNTNSPHILFTNFFENSLIVDGIDIICELKKMNVKIVNIPFTYKPPKGWYKDFGNQLYEFDCVDYFVNNYSSSDNLMILDSDCIILDNLDFAFERLKDCPALTFSGDYTNAKPSLLINGVTLEKMESIYKEFNNEHTPPHTKISALF